jgi:toxin ParE1/3/4
LIVSPEAQEDLENIYLEIAQDNPKAAAEFIRDMTNQIDKLANLGVTGSPRDWIKTGLRAFPYRKRCFYFRIDDERLILLRVLHGSQDTPNYFQ